MSDDSDLQAFLDSGGGQPASAQSTQAAKPDDLQAFLDSGGTSHAPEALAQADAQSAKRNTLYDSSRPAIGDSIEQQVHALLSGGYHAVVGGYKGLANLAVTHDPEQAADAVNAETSKSYQVPPEDLSGASSPAAQNAIRQMHQPASMTSLGDFASEHGASPGVSTALAVLPSAMSAMAAVRTLGEPVEELRAAESAPQAAGPRISDTNLSLEPTTPREIPASEPEISGPPLTATDIPRTPSWEAKDPNAPAPLVDSEPARGGLDLTSPQVSERAAILRRVGLNSVRNSALIGDRGNAATDFQLTKFNEPAGEAAGVQFAHEKQALTDHAANIVEDTGGTIGNDQDSLYNRGKVIDAPFKDLRQWFKTQSQNDYSTVKEQFGNNPIGKMDQTAALLKDPDFTETLLAKDQGGLLGSVQRQFQRFHDLNPNGFTVNTAENFRKFVNSVWTKQNSAALGKITDAVDSDVTAAAGTDVHEGARARVQLKHQLLDDPEGVSDLFDFDTKTPKNRSTAFNDIPKELTRLDPDQFKGVLDTLDQMPPELQPKAQAAKAAIKSQYANQLLDEGSKTQGQWNSPGVSKFIKNNSANLKIAFGDDPQAIQKIQDLDSAGRILKVDQSYPGAAAQAANAVKRGMMSHMIARGATSVGGMTGAAAGSIGGPTGAAAGGAIGAVAGEALGLKASQGLSESRALKGWQRRVTSLPDLMKTTGQVNK